MRTVIALLPILLPAALIAAPALSQEDVGPRLTGELMSPEGASAGSVSIFETPSGVIRINIQATGMTPGSHGVHLHEVGSCEDGGEAAGGHIAGDAMHGLVEGGPHPGDLPNGIVEEDGVLSMEALTDRLDVATLMDDDGSALVIHEGPDDYVSQPSGDSGGRVACAVLGEG